MKTTTNSRQTAHISYIHMHVELYTTTLCYKSIHLHSSNEENSQNKRADLDGSCHRDVLFFQSVDRSWDLIGCIDQDGPVHGVIDSQSFC